MQARSPFHKEFPSRFYTNHHIYTALTKEQEAASFHWKRSYKRSARQLIINLFKAFFHWGFFLMWGLTILLGVYFLYLSQRRRKIAQNMSSPYDESE